MTITQINNRYVVETKLGRLHVLNEKSLKWNLKKVFRFTPTQTAGIMKVLNEKGKIEVAA